MPSESENYLDSRPFIESYNEVFIGKLAVGEVGYDAERDAEFIEGINNHGKRIKVARPGLNIENFVSEQSGYLRYIVIIDEVITPSTGLDTSFGQAILALMENGQVYVLDEDDVVLGRLKEGDSQADSINGVVF